MLEESLRRSWDSLKILNRDHVFCRVFKMVFSSLENCERISKHPNSNYELSLFSYSEEFRPELKLNFGVIL